MTALDNAPDHWTRMTIGEVADVRLGRQRSPKNHSGDDMRPYLRAANVDWYSLRLDDVQEMNFTDDEMERYALQAGDILIVEGSGSASEVGKCVVVPKGFEDHGFQNTLIRVRPGEGVDASWLMYRINADAELGGFLQLARGSGIFHLGSTRTGKWPIAVPPLDEQQRIVAEIERRLPTQRKMHEELARAQRRIKTLEAVVLRSVVSGSGPDTPLTEAVEILDSMREPVNAKERARRPGDVPYYGATGKAGTIDKPIFNEPLVLLGEDGVAFDRPEAKKAYCIDGPAWVNNHAHVLRPGPGIRQGWLEAALNSADYRGLYSGTTRLKLTQTAMKKLEIPLPSLDEQDKQLKKLTSARTRTARLAKSAAKSERQTRELRLSILKAAFEGRL